jgi:hypothetical protein
VKGKKTRSQDDIGITDRVGKTSIGLLAKKDNKLHRKESGNKKLPRAGGERRVKEQNL